MTLRAKSLWEPLGNSQKSRWVNFPARVSGTKIMDELKTGELLFLLLWWLTSITTVSTSDTTATTITRATTIITLLFFSLGTGTEKAMAPHSSTLAWKIPWMEEPGGLQSMGSLRVGHNWATSLSLFIFMHWRRKWQPTPVFLPGESQGWWSLVGCCLWGRTESDTTEAT